MIEERIEERIKCPYCSEQILVEAKKCRFCGEWFKDKDKIKARSNITALRPPIDTSEKKSVPVMWETVKEPQPEPVKRPAERPKSMPYRQKRRTPWLRVLLTLIYACAIIAFVFYERQAHDMLNEARALESVANYREARQTYETITGKYWLSFAEIEARSSLSRINPGNEPRVDDFYLLPLAVWPLCSVLLFFVFITRILRPGMAFLAFLLLLLGLFGSLFQLTWFGLISIEPITLIVQEFISEPKGIFVLSYLMLMITALMTLTATRKFRFGLINND